MSSERAQQLVDALVGSIRAEITDHEVDYDEFHAAVQFLVRVGERGEILLLLAVFLERTVDEVTHAASQSSTTTIEGPFYVPGTPLLQAPCRLPRRADELGEVLVFSGTVRDTGGQLIPGAELDMWQATGDIPGRYSNVHPGLPDFNLRGRLRSDQRGSFEVETVVPAPYEIRKNGPTEISSSCSARVPGGRPTCTSRSARPGTGRSPPSSSSRATSTSTPTPATRSRMT